MHTPGPWHIGTGKATQIIYGTDGYAVANAVTYHGRDTESDMVENARLIAAAPELLAALERLSERCAALDQSATHDGIENCNAMVAARAAIAKAKGETT